MSYSELFRIAHYLHKHDTHGDFSLQKVSLGVDRTPDLTRTRQVIGAQNPTRDNNNNNNKFICETLFKIVIKQLFLSVVH